MLGVDLGWFMAPLIGEAQQSIPLVRLDAFMCSPLLLCYGML
jgi:hypothetical protein